MKRVNLLPFRVLLVLVLAASLSGCGQGAAGGPGASGPVPPTRFHTETEVVDFCPDRSASYNPSPALTEALQTVADTVQRYPKPGSSKLELYVWAIASNSFSTHERRMVIIVPAVPARPIPPDTTTLDQDQLAQLVLTYKSDLASFDTSLRAAQTAAKRYAHALRTLRLEREAVSSDIWGCFQRASELFANSLGSLTVIVASDLDFNGVQQLATRHHLDNSKVRVIDFRCDYAKQCQDRRNYWSRQLARSGTTNVRYFAPGQPVGQLLGQ